MISRTSESITCASPLSTDKRSCILPGCASKTTRDGDADAAGAASGTRPRKYGDPSGAMAITDTRAAVPEFRAVSPGAFGIGSHTNETFVRPS